MPVFFRDDKKELLKEQTSDFESIRYNSEQGVLFLADEGGKKGKSRIRIGDTLGNYINDFKLDTSYLKKIRPNKSFESLSFSKGFKSLFYATESALADDGNIPSLDNGGLVRIIESNLEGVIKKEFLYKLEKVPYPATVQPPWEGTGSDNGLSEIVSLGKKSIFNIRTLRGLSKRRCILSLPVKCFLLKQKRITTNHLPIKQ